MMNLLVSLTHNIYKEFKHNLAESFKFIHTAAIFKSFCIQVIQVKFANESNLKVIYYMMS